MSCYCGTCCACGVELQHHKRPYTICCGVHPTIHPNRARRPGGCRGLSPAIWIRSAHCPAAWAAAIGGGEVELLLLPGAGGGSWPTWAAGSWAAVLVFAPGCPGLGAAADRQRVVILAGRAATAAAGSPKQSFFWPVARSGRAPRGTFGGGRGVRRSRCMPSFEFPVGFGPKNCKG